MNAVSDPRLSGMLYLQDQEYEGSYDLRKCKIVATRQFVDTFAAETQKLVSAAIDLVNLTYHGKADYLQVLFYEKENEQIKFYLIVDEYEDGLVLTALLPSDR